MASSSSLPARPSRPTAAANDPGIDLANLGASPSISDDDSGGPSPRDSQQLGPASPDDSVKSSVDQDGVKSEEPGDEEGVSSELPSMPVQKRRRVTRACDECRRKKIKCDGKQPCTHCSVYSYECTYDKPSNRRRNPAPQYIEALESKLQRAESLLQKFMPEVDLNDPSLDPSVQQEFQSRARARAQAERLKRDAALEAENQDAQIQSMIETIGQLEINEGGEVDYHGISSGTVFLRRMKEQFPRGLLGTDQSYPFLPRPPRVPGMLTLDSPRSSVSSPWDSSVPGIYQLPPRNKALELCHFSLTCATCLLRIVHAPTFYEMVNRLYETHPEAFSTEDHRSLSLLYAVLALGCMYTPAENTGSGPIHYKMAMEEGLKYYQLARFLLQDITECRDMTSLQALLFLIMFLQATSNLQSCYTFIGIALRSALRMGLHRHLAHARMTAVEQETRRRVFSVIRQTDVYISVLLGFPLLLRDEDIDQLLPTEVDDEFITPDGILTPPPGTIGSFFEAFNAHAKLMTILGKVTKYIYPLKSIEECAKDGDSINATYLIPYARIKEIEKELHDWCEELPPRWAPNPDGPVEVVRVRTLLRFTFAHVQMILYRPFLHYISPRLSAGKAIDERYYACAAAGISVSRNIVHIGNEIKKQEVLAGPYWFILYTVFFGILSLVFYALENPEKPGSAEMLAEAAAAKDVINTLTRRSLTADRVADTLNTLFDQLPEQGKKSKTRPVPTKKRSAPAPKSGPAVTPSQTILKANPLPRKSDEMSRPGSGPGSFGHDHLRHINRGMSFDGMGRPGSSRQGQGLVSTFPEVLPLDMPSTAASSESGGTPITSHRTASFVSQGPNSAGANPVYKLDAMMFPSADPFAYPNQPMMDFGSSSQMDASHHVGVSQPADSSQFYMSHSDIEGHILGPTPPYLMHQNQQGLDLSAQVYNTSNMFNMQSQAQPEQSAQARQNRELDELMAQSGYKGDWGDMFGNEYRQL